jgi:hypothetical protein
MTAKEKAIELVDRFEHKTHSLVKDYLAKQCALILIEDRIATIKEYAYEESITPAIIHQLNIKKEIEKL